MAKNESIPVVDIFAGPGGLGEGFCSLRKGRRPLFHTALSIECDEYAHRTLRLRSFFRQFQPGRVPTLYYCYVTADEKDAPAILEELAEAWPAEYAAAESEAWCAELGTVPVAEVNRRIRRAIPHKQTHWVLIGGPPCQAYSMAGRSRMRPGRGKEFDSDHRHTLYREYLRIVGTHQPAGFVLENVKGLLSSQHRGDLIIKQILADLRQPKRGVEYTLVPLVPGGHDSAGLFGEETFEAEPGDFLIESELFGVPQRRHRVIIVGVRSDLVDVRKIRAARLTPTDAPTVSDVIDDLPRIRSRLSELVDNNEEWLHQLMWADKTAWFTEVRRQHPRVADRITATLDRLVPPKQGYGGRFVPARRQINGTLGSWYLDSNLKGAPNHESRSHIADDLHRYLFVSCFGAAERNSPKLRDFPEKLLPNHKNVHRSLGFGMFNDRFRVQLAGCPSTTVTSHIHKDGHYFIHYDPTQCRSLTVREAARLQTFPDNYFFEGPRTQQYRQVGNAVPPLLARQIGEVVAGLLG